MEIASAEQGIAVHKAERRCEKEWSEILKTLQKQLGDEQTRGAQMQIQCNRAERAYTLREAELQRQLGLEHAARMVDQNEHKVGFFLGPRIFSIYDLFPFRLLHLVHQVTLAKVDKLQQFKKEANHKLRNLRQQLARQNVDRPPILYDLTDINGEEERSLSDMREELDLLKLKTSIEDERLRRLVHGSGKGRPKSAEFEFASRTILATGVHFPNPYINPILTNTLTFPH
jgi:hypothetical protein